MKLISSYIDGRDLVLLHSTPDGLRRRAVPASYDYFVRTGTPLPRDASAVPDVPGFLRISCRRWDDRKQQVSDLGRRGIPTFEGDVSPLRRFISDHPEVGIAKPRRAYYDIETDSRIPFRDAREGASRVLCWCVRTQGETRTGMLETDTPQAERELLRAFWRAVADADVLLAWNGDFFDQPVLEARSKLLGCLPAYLQRWNFLDHLIVFKRANLNSAEEGSEKDSNKLDDIGEAVVGHGKQPFDSSRTWQAWANGEQGGREALLRYNIADVLLMEEIETKTGYIDLHEAVCQTTLVFPDSRGVKPTTQVDGFMMRLGPTLGLRLPTKDYDNLPPKHKGKGGWVMRPPQFSGIVEDVHVVDFAALYPSIIRTFNISIDTLDSNGAIRCPSVPTRFRNDIVGMLPRGVAEMQGVRKHWRDQDKVLEVGSPEQIYAARMSMGAKVATNAFYGVAYSRYSRYYSIEVGEAITWTGDYLLSQVVIPAIKEKGYHPGYGDTDSGLFTGATRAEASAFADHCTTTIIPPIVRELGCGENHIALEYEKRFVRMVISAPKKYAGIIETKDGTKLKIRGLELKRGDSSRLSRALQKEIVTLIVKDNVRDPETILEVIRRHRRHVLHDPLPLIDVQISKGIKGSIEGYAAQNSPHVRVAKILRDRGEECGDGTRIAYVITNGASSKFQNPEGGLQVIPAADYRPDPPGNPCDADRFHLWERMVLPATYRFVKAAFPDYDWDAVLLRDGRPKVSSLARRYIRREEKGQICLPGLSMKEMVNRPPARTPEGVDSSDL